MTGSAAQQPKYRRIAEELRVRIDSGEFGLGDRVPGEKPLSVEYGVAPMTARQALRVLQDEGLLESRKGAGFFVRARTPMSTGAEREERSRRTGSSWRAGERSDSHMAGVVAAPDHVAEALEITPGDPVLRRSRTYRDQESNAVISHSTSWIPAVFAEELPELAMGKRLSDGTSIDVITRHTGRAVARRISSIWARTTTPADAGPLEIAEDTRAAVIVMTVRVIDTSGMTIEYGVDVGGPGRHWTKEDPC